MMLFVDWNKLSVNEEGAFIDFDASVQVEAVYKCDSYDATEAMVKRIVRQELPNELIEQLAKYVEEQRGGHE